MMSFKDFLINRARLRSNYAKAQARLVGKVRLILKVNIIDSGVYLTKPTKELEIEYISFYQEWEESEEELIPFVIKKNPENFQSMLGYLSDCEKGIEPPEDWIPESSTYWLLDGNEMIGVVNIRHRLTEPLLKAGGHIGYSIRPSKRNKGYATQILSLALEKAKYLNLEKVLLVCNSINTASKKVIINNGGSLS